MSEVMNIDISHAGESKRLHFHLKSHARSRSIRISLYGDGTCIISKPPRISVELVERFLHERSEWLLSKVDFAKNIEWAMNPLTPRAKRAGEKKEYQSLKTLALQRSIDLVRQFNQFYKFRVGKVSIRNQSSRWGSCSKQHNLNFNYKIARLPQHLADYLVVHELCHIGEFNHSAKFWQLVAQIIPDYKSRRAELKQIKL